MFVVGAFCFFARAPPGARAPELRTQQISDEPSEHDSLSSDDAAAQEYQDSTRQFETPAAGASGADGACVAVLPALGTHGDDADAGFEYVDELPKPIIRVGPGTLKDSVGQAEMCLAATGRYFERAGTIVAATTNAATGEVFANAVAQSALYTELDHLADWYKKSPSGKWLSCHPSSRVCASLLEANEHPYLPALKGLAHQPFLRPDATLCTRSGYDLATGILAGFDERHFVVPTAPTVGDARAALELLDGLLDEFPFAADTDRSAALSAMLTAAVRSSLEAAPMFHVRAHQAGTGKSYLCRVITALAAVRPGRPMPFPGGDTECAKLLLSALKGSPAVIEFDNLTMDLVAHASLCSALTADQYSSRNLGHSQMKTVSTRALFLSSGNNCRPVGDMSRRCITIGLDAGIEMPATRKFKNPGLLDEVRKIRGRYISAALTVVRAWVHAGSPRATAVPLAGFTEWSDWCREPLLWLAKPDLAASLFAAMADDPERDLIGRLLAALRGHFASAPVMVKDMVQRALDVTRPGAADLLELLQEITGDRHRPT